MKTSVLHFALGNMLVEQLRLLLDSVNTSVVLLKKIQVTKCQRNLP